MTENYQDEAITNEELLGPPKIELIQIAMTMVGSIISGFVGSIVILISIYFFLKNAKEITGVYPFIYAMTGFFATLFTASLNIFLNKIINPNKYKRGTLAFAQVFLFSIFLFIFFLPTYISATSVSLDYLVYIFTLHIIMSILASNVFTEVLSNYRYVLLGLYGSFIGSLVSIMLTVIVFLTFKESEKNLFILIGLLILVNFTSNTIRSIFEWVYYTYYSKTGMDQLGDIFYQIEQEENEIVEKAKKELSKFN